MDPMKRLIRVVPVMVFLILGVIFAMYMRGTSMIAEQAKAAIIEDAKAAGHTMRRFYASEQSVAGFGGISATGPGAVKVMAPSSGDMYELGVSDGNTLTIWTGQAEGETGFKFRVTVKNPRAERGKTTVVLDEAGNCAFEDGTRC